MIRIIFFVAMLIFSQNLVISAEKEHTQESNELIQYSLFPVDFQNGQYHIAKNFPGTLILEFIGVATDGKIKNPKIIMDTPIGYSCLGACPKYANRKRTSDNASEWEMEKMDVYNIKRDGIDYVRYSIKLSESVAKMLNPSDLIFKIQESIYIKNNMEAPDANDKATVYIKLATDNWESKEKRINLILLPELSMETEKTKDFGVTVAFLSNLTVPNDEIRNAYISYWKSITTKKPYTSFVWNEWHRLNPEARKMVCSQFNMLHLIYARTGGTPTFFNISPKKFFQDKILADDKFKIPFMEISPDKGFGRFASTNPQKQFMLCPGYLATDSYWDEYIVATLKNFLLEIPQLSGIVYDIEPFAMGICVCENCRKDFKVFANLDHLPSAEETQKEYAAQWFNFRVKQNADIIKAFSNCVKKKFPGTLAILCTDPLTAGDNILSSWCGVDSRLSDNDVDMFMNMPYYSGTRYYDNMELNVRLLKKPNFPLTDPAERVLRYFICYTPDKVKQNTIATAALGGKGCGFWPDDVLDGKYLLAIKSAYAIIARSEDYYSSGRNANGVELQPQELLEKTFTDEGRNITLHFPDFTKTLRYTVHQKDDNYLVTLVNYDERNDAIVSIAIPALKEYKYTIKDMETGALYANDGVSLLGSDEIKKGFLVAIPRNGVNVIEISKNDIITLNKAKILQRDIKKKFSELKKKTTDNLGLKELKNDNSEISWGILGAQKSPLIKMTSGNRKIYVDAAKGAQIVSWNSRKNSNDILLFKSTRGFLDDLILDGKGQYSFSIGETSIENGNPVAKFKYTVQHEDGANAIGKPLEGLEVEKQITLENQGNSIKIKYTFSNKSFLKKDMRFGFRIKNYPRTALKPLRNETISQITQIGFETPEGSKNIEKGSATEHNLITAADYRNLEFFNSNIKPSTLKWNVSSIKVTVQTDTDKENITYTPDMQSTAAFYVWWSKDSYTIDFLSKEILLEYGGCFVYEYVISL